MAKNILQLTNKEALKFLLQSEQYVTFELPEYFNFDDLLLKVAFAIGRRPYEECLSDLDPCDLEGVNLEILLNKDGQYGVRPLTLANPVLYYFIVRELARNWDSIQQCFGIFQVPDITASALPIVAQGKEKFFKAATINNWWNTMEQGAIKLSLEYRYMFLTDITNCYGSINPQSIEWALNRIGTQHQTDANTELAHNLQTYLRAMQQGHNIGIPQGSTLFDFVAEIILGYADLLLHEALQAEQISGYRILRYRDDYRIFCNDKNTLEKISYTLQRILGKLNFNMNSQKTKLSDSIVTDAVKPDKLFYIYNTPIQSNKVGCHFDGVQKNLMYILMFGRQYPNCGRLRVLLTELDKRVEKMLKPQEIETIAVLGADNKFEELEEPIISYRPSHLPEDEEALVAVATQIAIENVGVSHYALRLISRIVASITNDEKKNEIIHKVYSKLCNQPNSDYNQLWLQNITLAYDHLDNTFEYRHKLCQLVDGHELKLWNCDWVHPDVRARATYNGILNYELLNELSPVIRFASRIQYDE